MGGAEALPRGSRNAEPREGHPCPRGSPAHRRRNRWRPTDRPDGQKHHGKGQQTARLGNVSQDDGEGRSALCSTECPSSRGSSRTSSYSWTSKAEPFPASCMRAESTSRGPNSPRPLRLSRHRASKPRLCAWPPPLHATPCSVRVRCRSSTTRARMHLMSSRSADGSVPTKKSGECESRPRPLESMG